MSLQIAWTPVALQSLSEVFEYTFKEFGERQVRKFIEYVRNARLDDATVWEKLSSL